MTSLYKKIKSGFYSQFLALALLSVLMVTGCEGGQMAGWPQMGGAQTSQPTEAAPDVAWQTAGQRKDISAAPAPVAAPVQKYKVALLLPLSGKSADLGQSMMKAAQMAVFDLNSKNVTLTPRDTASTPQGAAAAASAAIADGADIILGPIFAEDVKAAQPIIAAAGKPMIAFTTDWTLAGGNTYIMGFLPQMQVERVASYAAKSGYDHFAVFAPRTPYCDIVIDSLQKTGLPVSKIARYEPSQANITAALQGFVQESKIPNSQGSPSLTFNALMLPVGGENLSSIVAQFDQQGVSNKNTKFIGTGLWDDAMLTTNPSLFGSWFAAPEPALRRDFEKRYHDNYGAAPVRLSSLAYDATALSAVLAANANGDEPYSRARLTGRQGFAGIDGIFRFRADGLAERGLAVLELQAGRPRVIDPSPKSF